ncbi:MAG: TolC family protein [Candidatus Omnitrophica bacterium]|nr:TolC family protein [Candidatus Omnitrophota bacterium]
MYAFDLLKKIKIWLVAIYFVLLGWGNLFANEDGVVKNALSLDDCISQALKNHPKISIYSHKIDQKKEKLRSVTSEYLPQADIAASYDRLSYVTNLKRRYLGDSNDDYHANVIITQPLFTGGKITSQKRSARYAIDAAEFGVSAAREDVIYGVKSAYFKLLFVRDIMKSKEELLKYAQLSYNTALELHKRTKIPREEVLLRLEVQLNEVKQELIAALEDLMIAQKALLNAMGLDSNGSIEVQDLEDDFFTTKDIVVDTANNLEILKLSKELKEADEQIKIAKSGFYPQLNVRYSYGYEWGDWSQDGKTDWIAGVAINFNVWDWGKTKADVRQAKAHKEELQSYKDLLSQQIGLELESARLEYESAFKRFEFAKMSFEQAKRSLDLFESRYRDTLVTSVELLDAQKAFSQAQVNFALAKLDMRLAKAQIEKIAGKGYEPK